LPFNCKIKTLHFNEYARLGFTPRCATEDHLAYVTPL
jgi:hypothetical protein